VSSDSISTEIASLERGSAPPHDIEAEQSVLSAILLSERSLYGVVIGSQLRPEDFYRSQHSVIFEAMLALYNAGEPIDTLIIKEHLRREGRLEEGGGEAMIDALAAAAPAAANVRQYARIVREKALVRRLLSSTYEIQRQVSSGEGDPRDLVERAEMSILEVARDDSQKDFQKVGDILAVEVDRMEALSRGDRLAGGTPSGFSDLDVVTGGFQPGNLIIIAARPAMGKSALVTNMAENAAVDHGRAVALFSLEMSEAELAQRFVASQSRTLGEQLRKGQVPAKKWPKILEACDVLSKAPLYVDDTSDLGIMEIRAKARRLHQKLRREDGTGGLGLIIIDYLQLMRADHRYDSRVEQVGQMSRGLKILARELEVPVIALSQLSRAVEQRTDKRPILSDLRESGQIEQDADLVMFIYRDDYYNGAESERQGEADLIIAKHRNGPLDTIPLTFMSQYPKFWNLGRNSD
jgi:replicative DNA helicase